MKLRKKSKRRQKKIQKILGNFYKLLAGVEDMYGICTVFQQIFLTYSSREKFLKRIIKFLSLDNGLKKYFFKHYQFK